MSRRHWWLTVLAIVLFGLGGGAVAWERHMLRGSQDTVSMFGVLYATGLESEVLLYAVAAGFGHERAAGDRT